jgi:hypothetical protein
VQPTFWWLFFPAGRITLTIAFTAHFITDYACGHHEGWTTVAKFGGEVGRYTGDLP